MKTKIKEIYAYLSVKFTSFIQKYSQQLALTLALMFLILVTAFALSLSANSINVAEIKENSAKWQEYQLTRLEAEKKLNEAREAQEKLERRNELLRELFTPAENLK